jgi:hypothetical protein
MFGKRLNNDRNKCLNLKLILLCKYNTSPVEKFTQLSADHHIMCVIIQNHFDVTVRSVVDREIMESPLLLFFCQDGGADYKQVRLFLKRDRVTVRKHTRRCTIQLFIVILSLSLCFNSNFAYNSFSKSHNNIRI